MNDKLNELVQFERIVNAYEQRMILSMIMKDVANKIL